MFLPEINQNGGGPHGGRYDHLQSGGGIALFLYGMSIMGTGLEKLAGGKMEAVLQPDHNRKAVLLGAILTGLIQSSAGTTVICIGLVNSGIFTLSQAIGVIMGANIGTTVTGQLLSDISGSGWVLTMLKPSTFSPIAAGAVLFVFLKSPKKRNIGQICMGFGILFTGLFTMENAAAPLKDSSLVQLFTQLQNPVLGVLVGALVTVAIQSSSASVGILQALSGPVPTWAAPSPSSWARTSAPAPRRSSPPWARPPRQNAAPSCTFTSTSSAPPCSWRGSTVSRPRASSPSGTT